MKKLAFLGALLFSLLLSACNTFSGVGDDNRPAPTPLTIFTPELTPKILWTSRAGNGVKNDYLKLGPVVAANKVFIADANGKIIATDIKTGKRIWQTESEFALTSALATDENVLIAGTANGEVLAINIANGKIVWKTKVDDQILATPAIAQNTIIVKTINGNLYRLAENNGQVIWSYTHGSPTLILRGGSAPQINGDTVLAGFADGKLAAFRIDDGRLLWEQVVAEPQGVTQAAQMVDIVADLKLSNRVAYVGTYQGKIAAVNMQTGHILWQQTISTYTGLVLSNNTVFVTDAQGTLWAFARSNGNVLWRQKQLNYRDLTAPALMNGMVVVADAKGYVHWLSQRDGHFVARLQIGKKASIIATPLVVNKVLYLITTDGHLSAIQVD